MKTITEVEVRYLGRVVGTLALYKGRRCAFQYAKEWLLEGFPSVLFLSRSRKTISSQTRNLSTGYGVYSMIVSPTDGDAF